jgi:pimeloyl-ACP methyl ester carboxylesterase
MSEGMEAVLAAQAALAVAGSPSQERVLAERPGYAEFGDRKLLASAPAMYGSMIRLITAGESGIDRLDQLKAIAVPTLVIVGEEDTPFLKPSRRMADAVPGAELAVIPDAAHCPQFENADAWWSALSGFLARL